jgi:hypothetical protein
MTPFMVFSVTYIIGDWSKLDAYKPSSVTFTNYQHDIICQLSNVLKHIGVHEMTILLFRMQVGRYY